jgi:hypothetical protein
MKLRSYVTLNESDNIIKANSVKLQQIVESWCTLYVIHDQT